MPRVASKHGRDEQRPADGKAVEGEPPEDAQRQYHREEVARRFPSGPEQQGYGADESIARKRQDEIGQSLPPAAAPAGEEIDAGE